MQVWSAVLVLLSIVATVHCFSTGAPASACADIYPVGHSGTSQDLITNPFQLSLSDFDETYGGEFYYVPGQQYTLTLSGSGNEMFRGFLVQARTVADGSPVGVFTDNGNDQELSSCTPAESAVTHTSNDLKSSVTLSWTAPPNGTGEINFLYAIVVQNSNGISTFYATSETEVIHPCGLPLYESSGRCVETCPNGEFGNGNETTLTGVCQQLPADYRLALNATIYYAEISADTPLNTPVYRIRISINVNEQPIDISVRFFQTGPINSLFEFEGNTADTRRDISTDELETIGNERVFDTSINLVADPASQFGEDDYPVELGLIIQFVVFTQDFTSIQDISEGLGSIQPPPDPCDNEPCQNGASCASVNSTEYSCSCLPGFTGAMCEQVTDPCIAYQPCDNQATCLTISSSEYSCHCQPDYTGQNCSNIFDLCLVEDPCVKGNCTYEGALEYECECFAGYTGVNCSSDLNECLQINCFNGICIDGIASFTCECNPGYTGELCEFNINECEGVDCHNGTCTDLVNDYMCNCYQDYTGQHCDEIIDDCANSTCLNFTCEDDNSTYTCICDAGFTGPCVKISSHLYTCSQPGFDDQNCTDIVDNCLTNGCVNGICIDDIASFTCECNTGYTGELCNVNVNECETADCHNGTCIDLVNDYMCNCYQDYTGQHCDEIIDDCASSPCNLLSTLLCEDGNSTYTCHCAAGFTGQNCADEVPGCSSDPCQNGATCMNRPGGEFTCLCPPEWTGSTCSENPLPLCPCANGGNCSQSGSSFSCDCTMGWTGLRCDQDIDECSSNPCENGGTCRNFNGSFKCECPNGFSGSNCGEDLDFCQMLVDKCRNGVCVEGYGSETSCNCSRGYTGDSCDEDDPSELFCEDDSCANGGTCIEEYGPQTNCTCVRGFMGESCEEDDPRETFCDDRTCENEGACEEGLGNSTTCICVHGYTGPTCAIDLSFCLSDTCMNGGSCMEGNGSDITCSCANGFTGMLCETDIDLVNVDACQFEEKPILNGSTILYIWEKTMPGEKMSQQCPDICTGLNEYHREGVIVRECMETESGGAQWQHPDITACGVSITTLQLCELSQLPVTEIAAAAVDITSEPSKLDAQSLFLLSGSISELTEIALHNLSVQQEYFDIIDNILGANQSSLIESQNIFNTSSRILQSLILFQEKAVIGSDRENLTFARNNFAIIISDLEPLTHNENDEQTFSVEFGSPEEAVCNSTSISGRQLAVSSQSSAQATGSVSIPDTLKGRAGAQRVSYSVFRTDLLFLTPEITSNDYAIGSIIVGVRGSGILANNSEEALTIKLQPVSENCEGVKLPRKDIAFGTYDEIGKEWVLKTDYTENGKNIVSQSSKLGHFGLLFDLNPEDPLSPLALAIISYIGAFLSVVCLLIVIVTYLLSRKLRHNDHGRILVNLSISLTCLYVVFVIAGLVTSVKVLCGLVSALFQYFMLVYFGWTAAEALHLFDTFVCVFARKRKYYILKAALIVWLVPLLVVAISVGAGSSYYTSQYYCRATEWPFWFGHILPFCLIYIFNWAMFAVIMTSLFVRKIPSLDKEQRIKRVKQNIVVAIGLSVLFGLGWGFGLSATSSSSKEVTFVFQVIFSVFVGAQGIVIFILHGLRSQESRKVWKNLCICLSFKGEYHPSTSTKDKKAKSSTIPMTAVSENIHSSTCQSVHSMRPFTDKSEAKGNGGEEASEDKTVKINEIKKRESNYHKLIL